MNKRFFFIVVIVLGTVFRADCLSPVQHVTDQLRILSSPNLSYRYNVSLVDMRSGTVVDSNSGNLYRSGANFLDSNREFYTVITAQYFCKLDKSKQIASIYALAPLRQKLGIAAVSPSSPVTIVDSIGFKSPFPTIDSAVAGAIRATWQLRSATPSSFSVCVDRKTYKLLSVRIQTTEYADETNYYKRICVITEINGGGVQPSFDLKGVFTVEAKEVIMNPKYASYKVKSLID